MLTDSFSNNYESVFLRMVSEGYKLVIWGTGREFEKTQKRYFRINDAAYAVDNNKRLWGSEVNGLQIKPPNVLKEENRDNIVVLIVSQHLFSIEKQLIEFGIKHYFASLLFLDRYIINHDVSTIILKN